MLSIGGHIAKKKQTYAHTGTDEHRGDNAPKKKEIPDCYHQNELSVIVV